MTYPPVTSLFCDVDDFCIEFEPEYNQSLITLGMKKRIKQSTMSLSEVMTIIILFHCSNYRTFKMFYTGFIAEYHGKAFPDQVSYNRFIELKASALIPLCCYLNLKKGKVTGITFVDSTSIKVCNNRRIHSHKVFKTHAKRGKNSMGWFYGFKLHIIINDQGELLAFKLTPGNVDDRKPVPDMASDLFGKLFGDKGYISQKLFDELFDNGVQLITKIRKNMKNILMPVIDKILLRKRALIETVNDQLKNISQIEHTRHRSVYNFMVNIVAGLIAYTWQSKKPSLNLNHISDELLPIVV
jgi:hypothetical protein